MGHYNVSRGIAAEDLAADSIILKIISPTYTPGALKGDVGASITNLNLSLKDRDGNSIITDSTTSNHIVATWEGSSNMKTPPLIRKGEPVEFFKLADQDKYYWRATGRGSVFRKTDRIHVEVSATNPDSPGEENNDTNTYSAYLDSDRKKVGFKTSKKNGEAVGVAAEFDLNNGTFVLTDDSGDTNNRIFMDSGKVSGVPVIQMNLNNGSMIKLEGENLIIKVKGKILISSSERIILDAPILLMNIKKAGAFIVNAASIALNATGDIVQSASGVIGLNSVGTKVSGFLAAGATRLESLTKGSAGSSYSPSEISDPVMGGVSSSSNSPDTTPGGNPDF